MTVMTGAIDIVSDGNETWLMRNGCPQMARITGSGCMLDGIIAAYCAAAGPASSQTAMFQAAALATAAAGLCGELASKKAAKVSGGTGSFHCCFLDEVSLLEETP